MRCCSREHYGRVTILSADRPVLAALQVGATASALTFAGRVAGQHQKNGRMPGDVDWPGAQHPGIGRIAQTGQA